MNTEAVGDLEHRRKFSFLRGGGQGPSIFRVRRNALFDVFARRPDVKKVLKCAKRIGISDFTTTNIQQILMKNDKNISYG